MKKISRKLLTIITIIICSVIGFSWLAITVIQDITPETGEIYVLGYKDNFPVEAKINGSWEGIMPRLFDEIEKQTGITFAYVEDGGNREELISNQQVEIIGALTTQEGENLVEHYNIILSEPLFCYNELEYHIGFSAGLSEQHRQSIEQALNEIDAFSRTEFALESAQTKRFYLPFEIYLILLLLIIALVMTLVSDFTTKKSLVAAQKEIDEGVVSGGIKNYSFFKNKIDELKKTSLIHLKYVALLEFDNSNVKWFYGEKESESHLKNTFEVVAKTLNHDEFVARLSENNLLMIFNAKSNQEVGDKIEDIFKKINANLAYKLNNINMPLVIGICKLDLIEDEDISVARILRYSIEMAKNESCTIKICDNEMISNLQEVTTLGRELIEQTDLSEFVVYALPVIEVETNKITGVKALARWEHPTKGLLQPKLFLKQFEMSGKVVELNYRIFDYICEHINKLDLEKNKQFFVTCEMSLLNLQDPKFKIRVLESLSKHKVARDILNIEIKSKYIDKQSPTVIQNLEFLKSTGIKLSIGDFSGKHTSLALFPEHGVESLVLDPMVLNDAQSIYGIKLIEAAIMAARSLNIKIEAKKIETKEQEIAIKKLKIDNASGYRYFKPVPFSELAQIL